MFFLNVEYLLEKKECLIPAHKFEKWAYGPVVKQVYNEYGYKFGANNIIKPTVFKFVIKEHGKYKLITYTFNKHHLPKDIRNFIDANITYFLNQPVFDLVTATQKDPQWKNKASKFYNENELVEYYSIRQFWRQDKKLKG